MKHIDIAGRELAVGDKVAITQTGYRNMEIGTIEKFTPKGMQVRKPGVTPKWENPLTFRTGDMVCKVVA